MLGEVADAHVLRLDALTTGIQGLAAILRGIIVLGIATAPIWLAIIALVLVVRWRMRVRKAKQAGEETAE
jgi:hypothetical protein